MKTFQCSHPSGSFSEPVRVKPSFAPQIILVDSSSKWYFHYLFICLPLCKILTYLFLSYQYLIQYLNYVTFHTSSNGDLIEVRHPSPLFLQSGWRFTSQGRLQTPPLCGLTNRQGVVLGGLLPQGRDVPRVQRATDYKQAIKISGCCIWQLVLVAEKMLTIF